ncbi:hypothetical protein DFQ28_004388, partial [Apophysomyces sp. BC1034]
IGDINQGRPFQISALESRKSQPSPYESSQLRLLGKDQLDREIDQNNKMIKKLEEKIKPMRKDLRSLERWRMNHSKAVHGRTSSGVYERLKEIRQTIRTKQAAAIALEDQLKQTRQKRYILNKVKQELEKKNKGKARAGTSSGRPPRHKKLKTKKHKTPNKGVITEGSVQQMASTARELFMKGSVPISGVDPGLPDDWRGINCKR